MDKQDFHGNEIAIIGLGGRFPGADDVASFWQNIAAGVCSIRFFTDEELLEAGVPREVLSDPSYVKAGSFIENVDLFDALFFGYSPREATIIDPQQRLFLECAWSVLEDAGYTAEGFPGSIGVFAGTARNTYLLNNLYPNPEVIETIDGFQLLMASDKDHLATRTSYKLNLRGPSITVQTSCSTSLVAIHLACQSLLSGECDLALAGGVSVKVPGKKGYFYREGDIFSPDGFCRSFDARARGTVEASGMGIVALRRLSDSLEDRDHIYAIIKGSAINNDGSLKAGYAALSMRSQTAVIGEALSLAGVDPAEISYIEAQGTGTPIGDPIEIAALNQVFTAATDKVGFCAIGSVKTNIGHTDAAAGAIGMIKTTLALKHRSLPPSLHFVEPNPAIDFAHSPFFVNTTLKEWTRNGLPRRAGVSSFGLGGTNVHMVLEEAPVFPDIEAELRSYQLLVLSAKTPTALDTASKRLAAYLSNQQEVMCLPDVAWTLQTGRAAFDYRQVLLCQDLQEAARDLQAADSPRLFRSRGEPGKPSLVFLFPGQGTQYIGMGRELYEQEEVFRRSIDQCCAILEPLLGLDLRTVFSAQATPPDFVRDLNQTWLAQPTLFVLEYALASLWMHWGIKPEAFMGHSIGEYVAACLAGVFSLKDALTLVTARGRLVQSVAPGSMLAISLPYGELVLPAGLSLAAINGAERCVVSGPANLITALERSLQERGIECRQLQTPHAFHSAMLEGILPAFADEVRRIHLAPPQIPCLSNVSGTWMTAEQAVDPHYWVQQLRQTVLFGPALEELKARTSWVLLEVGPGQTLSTLARRTLPGYLILTSLPGARDHSSAAASMLTALGRLWLAGCSVAWPHLYSHKRQRLSLPTYPFERQRYWIEAPGQSSTNEGVREPLHKKSDISNWFYVPVWKQSGSSDLLTPHSLLQQKECWLVFLDECGLGQLLVRRLEQEGQYVVTVTRHTQYSILAPNMYAINPQQRDDYKMLLSSLHAEGLFPQKIIHLWNVTSDPRMLEERGPCEYLHTLSFFSLLYLAQALGEHHVTKPIFLGVVANQIQEVTGEEGLCPEKALAIGPCKVIPAEYPNITCRCIDIVLSERDRTQQEILVDQIMTESLTDVCDTVVAYRGKYRWVQTFDLTPLHDTAGRATGLRERGVYLITGGLGGMGLTLAEYLAQRVQAKLILVGRSNFPERSEWEHWLAVHDGQDEVSRKLRKLQEIETLGAEILIASVDVTDQKQMQILAEQAYERFGVIHGIFHTAGVAERRTIHLQTLEAAAKVLAPKVTGARVLESVFGDTKLDFLILCSSIGSILANFGQISYCAANAFLNAFAYYSKSRYSTPTMAIDWDMWQEVGMAVNTPLPQKLQELRQQQLKNGILPREGITVFERLLGRRQPQFVVSTTDFHITADQHAMSDADSLQEELEHIYHSKFAHPRPLPASSYVAPRNDLEQQIAIIWQDFLGIEQVSIYDNFFELGGDSLLVIQFASYLYSDLEVNIHMQELLDTPTVASIAELIQRKQAEEDAEEDMEDDLA